MVTAQDGVLKYRLMIKWMLVDMGANSISCVVNHQVNKISNLKPLTSLLVSSFTRVCILYRSQRGVEGNVGQVPWIL